MCNSNNQFQFYFFLPFLGAHAITPEFCSDHHTLTIQNSKVVNKGIIYSPNYPEEYDSTSRQGEPCSVRINGLFESSWIRLEQVYVEQFGFGPRRTFQPCIEQDFIIHNQSLPKDHYHCPLREGTMLNRKSIDLMLSFVQKKMPPFTIEFTSKVLNLYPLNIDCNIQ